MLMNFSEYFDRKTLTNSYGINECSSNFTTGYDGDYLALAANDLFDDETVGDIVQSTLAELIDKYSDNDAVNNISIRSDEYGNYIQFDVMCETDVDASTTEYNGIRLKYNLMCDIRGNVINK